MPKRTLILTLTLAGIVLFLLAVSLIMRPTQPTEQTIVQQPTVLPSPTLPPYARPQTGLSFSPNPLTVASSSGTLQVTISTGDNPIRGVQLVIGFDPKIIAVSSITPGGFLGNAQPLLSTIDNKNGKITYLLSSTSATGNKGNGTVAVINIRKIGTAPQTSLSFLPETLVTAVGVEKSTLQTAATGTILFSPTR